MNQDTKNTTTPLSFTEEFIPTLNNTGFMTTKLDPYSKQFIEYASHLSDPVLEVGAAYGVASIAALKAGATVIANDLDERHLEILKQETPIECRDRLTLLPGDFPDGLVIAPNSLGGVLICRVLHWFQGEKLEKAMAKLFEWLKPNAKIFLIADTPYLGNFQPVIPIYEENIAKGNKWPGYITGIKKLVLPQYAKHIPDTMHFLDPRVLSNLCRDAGFLVETATTFSRAEYPREAQLDGREGVVIIAQKP